MQAYRRKSTWIAVSVVFCGSSIAARQLPDPYARQVAEQIRTLHSVSESARAGAAEALGFLRAYAAEKPLIERLGDNSPVVRRQTAMALGWCGSRKAVGPLLDSLGDDDPMTRQAAHVALTNLTGMELPFDTTAPKSNRSDQIRGWRAWWSTVRLGRVPEEVHQLLEGFKHPSISRSVTVSSMYKGPPEILTDDLIGPGYWQTKNVPFPQWCTVDLGRSQTVSKVTIHQYGPRFVLTDYELSTRIQLSQGAYRVQKVQYFTGICGDMRGVSA